MDSREPEPVAERRDPAPKPGAAAIPPSARRVRIARTVAIVADVLQIALFPLVAGGVLSPLNDSIDAAVAVILVRLLGWHWAFLPTFIAEIVPGLDLVPTWTAAVWLATRRGSHARVIDEAPET